MASPIKRRATYDDLLQVPPHRVAEIVDGDLHVSPRPASRHALASSRLGSELVEPFDRGRGGPGGWWILFEPELHLGDDVLVPDLAGWRRERMPAVPETAYFALAPDWVCEVLSSGTARLDRQRKLAVYAREGIAHVWLLDPIQRILEVLRLERRQWMIVSVHADEDEVCAEPFEATTLPLLRLWTD